jgi:hypothetical protein
LDVERHNWRQIEMLNQRGGRTLSIVDLIRAGTISAEMAAYAMRAMHRGTSLLTGARPSGAGKTSLMAALLGFLPPETPIATVDSAEVVAVGLAQPADMPVCYLVHEIGSGSWFGYLWGPDVSYFLDLIEGPRRIASCLHADTLEELTGILCSPALEVSREALGRVGLILFMKLDRTGTGLRRRVSTFYEADGFGSHALRFAWEARTDEFRAAGPIADKADFGEYLDFIRSLVEEGEVEFRAVRSKILGFYRARS